MLKNPCKSFLSLVIEAIMPQVKGYLALMAIKGLPFIR